MRLLVTGSRGQLGWELARSLLPLGEVVALDRSNFDLSQPQAIAARLDAIKPDVIVNAAAYTAVDKAETEEAVATCINGDAVGAMVGWAAAHKSLVVHYSTDYIFDGTSTAPYGEADNPNPLNAYGRSKLSGERALGANGADFLCFRTSWVYAARGRNFLLTMLRLAQEREQLSVVSDQIGAPTWARNISDATALVIQQAQQRRAEGKFQSGLYHLTASGQTSWHEFASVIFEHARKQGLPLKLKELRAISSADYPTPARRPQFSCLDGARLRKDFGVCLPDWRQAVDHCVADLVLMR